MMWLLILRRNQANELGLPQEEMLERFKRFTLGLQAAGALRGVERLKPAVEGMTHRGSSGAIGGPYEGAGGESVIGYFLVEAGDREAVCSLARECPILLVGGSVEIRETEAFQ